jgi:hypothetical protein
MLAASPSSFASPSPFALRRKDSYVHQQELESKFCRDLVCCNQPIADLHELLQHYEEQHVDIHATDATTSPRPDEDDDEDEEMEEDDEDDTHGNLPILLSSQDMSALEHESGNLGLNLENMEFSHFGAHGLVHPGKETHRIF